MTETRTYQYNRTHEYQVGFIRQADIVQVTKQAIETMLAVKDCPDLMVHDHGVVLAWLKKRDDKTIFLVSNSSANDYERMMIQHAIRGYDPNKITLSKVIPDDQPPDSPNTQV